MIKNSKFKIQNSNKGFTLVEVIVFIAIFSIVMLGITNMFRYLYLEQRADIVRIRNREIAERVIEIMGKEIRKMNRAENGSFSLELAQNQNIIFYSDIDNDGATEKVEYFLNGTNLEKILTEPGALLDYSDPSTTTVIASNVVSGADSLFEYYDENYTGTQSPMGDPVNVVNIRLVAIILKVNVDSNAVAIPLLLETKIHPRNLKISS